MPDAESAGVLLGASLPPSLVTLSGIDARLTSAGSFAVAGTVAWIGASGGAERPSAAIGAWACLGVLVALPTIAPGLLRLSAWRLAIVQTILVFKSARVFGLWGSTLATATAVVVSAVVIWRGAPYIAPAAVGAGDLS